MFVTNNSFSTRAEQELFLSEIGIDARNRVVSSAVAAGSLVGSGERVLVVGGPGISEAVHENGGVPVQPDGIWSDVDSVIVGFDRGFNFDRLTSAVRAVRGGARLIGTNHDPTYPTPKGEIPGGGSLVAAAAYASETEPIYAGKPMAAMFNVAISRACELVRGDVLNSEVVVVGDRVDSDGEFARRAGVRYCHVQSGVNKNAGSSIESYVDLSRAFMSLMEGNHG